MFFWKKRKTVTVRCYPQFTHIQNLFPIVHTRKMIPDWWKNLPSVIRDNSGKDITTIKSCPGFSELYKRGISLPMWRDTVIKYDKNRILDIELTTFEDISQWFVLHPPEQMGSVFNPWLHLKIISPWFLETDEPVPFLMIDMAWNRKTLGDYSIPPGMLEFKYQHATHINMFLEPTEEYKEIKFQAGTPLIQLIPLTDVDLELEICDPDDNKIRSMRPYSWTAHNVYAKTRNILEKNT